MFTGIVEERGVVEARVDHALTVACRVVLRDADVGASLAVNGVCLTVVERAGGSLRFDLSEETLARTSLRRLSAGDPVNLERPLTLAGRLGGHLVQGHVDGVGTVGAVAPDDTGGATVRLVVPAELLRYLVPKGSVAVDGVSLTVASLDDEGCTIAVIPHTRAVTTFGSIREGDPVNIETDVLAKYVERLIERAS
jgi:riboflavin synthase